MRDAPRLHDLGLGVPVDGTCIRTAARKANEQDDRSMEDELTRRRFNH